MTSLVSASERTAACGAPTWTSALRILLGASVWGVAWYPYRLLAHWGLGSMLAAALTGMAAAIIAAVVLRRHLRALRVSWLMVALGLAAGVTNVGFVWGTVHGAVMRVLLLFYLCPIWTALLARLWLHERLGARGAAWLVLALGGAALMLGAGQAGLPWPGTPAEWSGLIAGLAFACNNVLARLAGQRMAMRAELRTVVVFAGCAVVGLPMALWFDGASVSPAALGMPEVWLLAGGMAAALALGNIMVQQGLQRLSANRAALLMLFEIVAAALSSSLLSAERLSAQEMAGGACIILAGALSGLARRKPAS